METWQVATILWGGMLLLIAFGVPIAFAIGGMAVFGSIWVWGGVQGLTVFSESAIGLMTSTTFVAIPLFMFMAELLRHSGISAMLYTAAERWVGKLPGGLGVGTMIMAGVLGAMLGVSPASTAIMASTSMEPMLKRGYDKHLVVGLICAGGAVGVVIPPSVIMIIYASITGESVGRMFAGGMAIGCVLVLLMISYILIIATLNPKIAPPSEREFTWKEKFVALKGIIAPAIVIMAVLGTIYLGIATATEAAGIGAFCTLAIVASQRKLSWGVLKASSLDVARMFCMVAWIAICAIAFSKVVHFAGISEWTIKVVTGFSMSKYVVLTLIIFVLFILGFILDPVGIIMITAPVFAPIIATLGIDSLWFAVLFIVVLHTSYLTPPVGFNLFVMKVMVPPEITTKDIYRGVIPFVALQLLTIALMVIFPSLIRWLPASFYGVR
jgi:tripartite ATP-independent transporter DctM subunit